MSAETLQYYSEATGYLDEIKASAGAGARLSGGVTRGPQLFTAPIVVPKAEQISLSSRGDSNEVCMPIPQPVIAHPKIHRTEPQTCVAKRIARRAITRASASRREGN